MTATTTLARNGTTLGGDYNRNGWADYIGSEYNPAQAAAMIDALMRAQRDEFDGLLPEGCYWHPSTSEIVGPVGTDLPEDLGELMEQATEAVTARYATIEAEVLAQ